MFVLFKKKKTLCFKVFHFFNHFSFQSKTLFQASVSSRTSFSDTKKCSLFHVSAAPIISKSALLKHDICFFQNQTHLCRVLLLRSSPNHHKNIYFSTTLACLKKIIQPSPKEKIHETLFFVSPFQPNQTKHKKERRKQRTGHLSNIR